MIDASDLLALSEDLGKVSASAAGLVYEAVAESAEDVRNTWRRNAKQTSGSHARFYPNSITFDMRLGFQPSAEIGPDPRLKQGFLGYILEFGGAHSPPHLDGQRATDTVEPRFHKRVQAAADGLASIIETGNTKREYTTRSGRTIMATDAQIAHWTRGS